MLRRALVGLALAVLVAAAATRGAWADVGITCPPGQRWDATLARCVLVVVSPGAPAPTQNTIATTAPAVGSAPKCTFNGAEIPCTEGAAWWSPGGPCYITPQSDAYPPTHEKWQGNYPKGAIYLCANPFTHFNYTFWALTPPPGPAAPADPATLAQRAVAEMTFRAITIGMVPDEGIAPDGKPYVGLVGLPTWMWVANPTPETAGPQTRTVSAGGITVTATATLQRVVWDMGENRGEKSVVTCGAGTPYMDSYGGKDSPTCGYRYQTQGTHTVTATSYWTVAWSGAGQSGTIPLHFTSTRQVAIGELQVLRTR